MAKTSTNSANSTPSTKSIATDIPSAAASAATVPNPTAVARSQGKPNPLSAVMKLAVNLEVTDPERQQLADFLTGAARLSDSHLSQAAAFFTKRTHVGYTQLGIKVAGQLAFEDGGSIPQFRSEIESHTSVVFAIQDQIDRSYSDTYQSYSLGQIKAASAYLWDSYGATGTVNPGLIDRANARAKNDRELRNVVG